MALDKQINLFRVDTNAFLNREEKQRYKQIYEIKAYEKDLLTLKERLSKEAEENNDSTKSYDCALLDNKILEMSDYASVLKKIYKPWLLQESLECVEYNNTHKDKRIRQLDTLEIYESCAECARQNHYKSTAPITIRCQKRNGYMYLDEYEKEKNNGFR